MAGTNDELRTVLLCPSENLLIIQSGIAHIPNSQLWVKQTGRSHGAVDLSVHAEKLFCLIGEPVLIGCRRNPGVYPVAVIDGYPSGSRAFPNRSGGVLLKTVLTLSNV